jgi:dTDP-4-dehydrorhamnose 3,5-epimerase
MDHRVTVLTTPLRDVVVIEFPVFADHRGAFARLFCRDTLSELMGARQIVQINRSRTHAVGAVRGLHYQRAPHMEMKFVRCLAGRVWDVAVDLRTGSSTFLRWHAEELSAENGRMIGIPEGFAHGFQVMEPDSELLYLHTAAYEPAFEGGVQPTDPVLDIRWPLPIAELSERDRSHPLLARNCPGLTS